MYTFSKDDLEIRKQRKSRLSGNNPLAKKKIMFAAGFLTLVLLAGIWIHIVNSIAYAVTVNGKQVLICDNKEQAEQAVSKFLETKSEELGMAVTTEDRIEIKEIKVNKKDRILTEDIGQLLEQELNILVPGAAFIVNGEEKAVLADRRRQRTCLKE